MVWGIVEGVAGVSPPFLLIKHHLSLSLSLSLPLSLSPSLPLSLSPWQTASSPGLLLVSIAWSMTEVIRYSFYFFSLLNFIPYPIQWLRYNTEIT